MHIVYITKEFPPSARAGGIGSYVREIAKGMLATGNKVTVITASDDTRMRSDTVEDGIRVIRLDGGDFWVPNAEPGNKLKKLRTVYRFRSFRKKLRKTLCQIKDADIVEVADFGAESLYLHNLYVPVVVRLHTPSALDIYTLKARKIKWWKLHRSLVPIGEKRVMRDAKYISGCSKAIINWADKYLHSSARITCVVNNPAKLDDKDYALKSFDCFTVFCAGTISETKGVGDLVDACRILIRKGVKLRLLLAGKEGQYAETLKQTMRDQQEDWCVFLGKLDREELFSYYHSADVCCFPSWWENMPMVCLESMSCGALVIAGNSGGTVEIISDGVDGFITPIKDPEILADVIEKVRNLSDAEKASISKAAKDTIRTRFDINVIVSQMLDFYNQVIIDFKSK